MIYVFDPDDVSQRRNWLGFLSRDFILVETLADALPAEAIVFVHGSYLTAERQKVFIQNNPVACMVVISGGERPAWWSDSERAYWRRSPVGKPNDTDFGQCVQRFLAEASAGKKFSEVVYLLDPIDADDLWALHVLCEAWLFAEAGEHHDIVLKPTDWLAPFDVSDHVGGLFDQSGMLVHQVFLRARQAENAVAPTKADVSGCLGSVIQQLTMLTNVEGTIATKN